MPHWRHSKTCITKRFYFNCASKVWKYLQYMRELVVNNKDTLIQKAMRFSWLQLGCQWLNSSWLGMRFPYEVGTITLPQPGILRRYLWLCWCPCFSSRSFPRYSPSPARNSRKVFGNLSMYLYPARNLPRYYPFLARNSSHIFEKPLVYLFLDRSFPGYSPSPTQETISQK